MATPKAAEHRDLEQRFRNIENTLQRLTSQSLRRDQLGVSSGDFAVTGGGSVVVEDGGDVTLQGKDGQFRQVSDDGRLLLSLGGVPDGLGGISDGAYLFLSKDGTADHTVFAVSTVLPGDPTHPDGFSAFQYAGDSAGLIAKQGVVVSASADGSSGAILTVLPSGVFIQSGDLTNQDGAVMAADLYLLGANTTSQAANVYRDPNSGRLRISTSSLRYKQDVEPAPDHAEAFLTIEPQTWRDRGEVDEDPDTEQRHIGYVAEHLHDAGLGQFVSYDDQGRPDAVSYDRLTVPLLQLAQRQQAQLDALTARLDALEGNT